MYAYVNISLGTNKEVINMNEGKYLKTSQYAKMFNQKRPTVTKHFHQGLIPGYQDETTGTIFLENPNYHKNLNKNKAILYARVSSTTDKASLDGQIERMRAYAAAKGYTVIDEVKEIASGINDQRPKLRKVFKRNDYSVLIAEHKDRLTRFGYYYISDLLHEKGVDVEIINQFDDTDSEMMDDFISIVTSLCHRLYGRNRKKKIEKIIKDIKNETKQ